MNILRKEKNLPELHTDEPVIVIGTGPIGIQFINSVLENDTVPALKIFGDEPWEPYNRVKLSSFFAGHVNLDELAIGRKLQNDKLIFHNNCAIAEIDPVYKTVTDELGIKHPYSKLILATGSRPHIPKIPGVELANIFTFRNMTDIENLLARRNRSRKTVVIGGGVLGIEAAKAMSRQNTEVTIIDHSLMLMSNQLDEYSSDMLRDYVLSLGIKVYLGQVIKEFKGDGKVESIRLLDGREIEFDTVILTTGITPNVDLARSARLNVGRGIRVNDAMQTSDPNIYAIGECAEHRGKVYGIVKPGYEQAKVAAYSLYGKKKNYTGSLSATQIKVIDINVFSMGDVDEVSGIGLKKEYIYNDASNGIYRKIVVKNHAIIGAIAVGSWSEQGRVQEAIVNKRFIAPWDLIKFKHAGYLWPKENSDDINQWPASTIVCNCTGVTRGQLSAEIAGGINTITELSSKTGASTVCGGCKPLVTQLLTGTRKAEAVKGYVTLFAIGLLTTLLALLGLALPEIPYAQTAEQSWSWDVLWRENLYKQISGFTLLGLSVIALLMSLRKRVKKFTLSNFQVWRIIHVILGFLTVIGLVAHSGTSLGQGINYYLALSFIGILIAGGASSLLVAYEHKLDVTLSRKIKSKLVWLHILAFWPFPALIAAHIFTSYYF